MYRNLLTVFEVKQSAIKPGMTIALAPRETALYNRKDLSELSILEIKPNAIIARSNKTQEKHKILCSGYGGSSGWNMDHFFIDLRAFEVEEIDALTEIKLGNG